VVGAWIRIVIRIATKVTEAISGASGGLHAEKKTGERGGICWTRRLDGIPS